MVIDRGGFRYVIKAIDQFTDPVRDMRAEVAKLKGELDGLAKVRRASSSAASEERARERELAKQIRENRQQSALAAQRQRNFVREQARLEREASRDNRAASALALRIQRQNAEAIRDAERDAHRERLAEQREITRRQRETAREATRQVLERQRAERALAREQAKDATARNRQLAKERRDQERITRERGASFRRLTQGVLASGDAANRVSFTFRRLFGILAAFQAVRLGGQLFAGGIAEGFRFNAVLEDTEIGLAAVIAALADVRATQNGPVLTGAEAFAASITIARDQMAKLKVEALRTTATFEEIVSTYQAGLAAGLGQVLSLDDIRQLTIRVSQAARALQVPQNQLLEEIRSLLTGTGRPTTSIIESRLGLNNEQIKGFQNAGTLKEELNLRLAAFGDAAEAAERTVTGLSANIKDAFQLILSEASNTAFGTLRDTLGEVRDSLLDIDLANKTVTVNARLVQTLKPVYDAVGDSIRKIFDAFRSTDPREAQAFFQLLGDAISLLTDVVLAAARGIGAGIKDIRRVFLTISNLFGNNIDSSGFVKLVEVVIRFSTVAVGLTTVLAILVGLFKGLVGPIAIIARLLILLAKPLIVFARAALFVITTVLPRLVVAFATAFTGIARIMVAVFGGTLKAIGAIIRSAGVMKTVLAGALVGGIIAASAALHDFTQDVTGLNLTFTETLTALGASFSELGVVMQRTLELVLIQIGVFIRSSVSALFSSLFGLIADGLDKLGNLALNIPIVGGDIAASIEGVADGFRFLGAIGEEDIKAGEQQVAEAKERLTSAVTDLTQALQESVDTGKVKIGNSAKNGFFGGFFSVLETGAEKAFDFAADVRTAFESIPTSVEEVEAAFDAALDAFFENDQIAELNAILDENKNTDTEANATGRGKTEPGELEQFLKGIVENFESGLAILRPLIQEFSSFISDSIVDAFDPTSDTDLLERFARFLQSLAKLIIQTLVQVAVAQATLGVFFPSPVTPPGGGTPIPGRAEGGPIPHGHATPKSFRPKGLDPRDTTLIYAQPEEFMLRRRASKKLGLARLNALNDGNVDLGLLDAALGKRTKKHLSGLARRPGIGYAAGGSIAAPRRTKTGSSNNSAGGAPAFTPAVVVANDQTLNRLLAGGHRAFVDYMSDNAAEIDAVLRRGRGK